MATSTSVEFDRKEWDKLLAKVRKKWKEVEKRKEYAKVISAPVFADVIQHFDKEEGPDGKWKSWSTMYSEHMKRIGRSTNKILQFNGKLRQAFQPTSWRAQAEGVMFFNNAKVKGSNFPYAMAHDEGGPKLPQRKFMWISEAAMVTIVKITEAWINPDSGE